MISRSSLLFLVASVLLVTTGAFVGQPNTAKRRLKHIDGSLPATNQATAKEDDNVKSAETSGMTRSRFLQHLVVLPLMAAASKPSAAPAHASMTASASTENAVTTTCKSLVPSSGSNLLSTSSLASSATTSTTTLEESISGFLAGGALTVTKTIVKYPLDTATVRLQMPGTTYSVGRIGELMDGCYNGVSTPLLSNIPAGGVFFAVKDATKTSLKAAMPDLPPWQRTCLAVAAAQLPYWAVRNPSEVIKTRQQANIPGYTNVTAWQAWQQVGADANQANATAASAFYTGYWENILYAYPADVIKFLVYDRFAGSAERLSPAKGALAGAFATAVAQFATTPLDVVRNRVMAKERKTPNSDETTIASPSSSSYLNTLIDIGRYEGLSGLLAGAIPRGGKAILSGAIQFATYEETKKDLTNFFAKRKR